MRIIAGKHGGRRFLAPNGARTHPMSQKMRGALFNALGDITGLSVLDCFGGSGALSFEAISRGALPPIVVERDKSAHKTIISNIKALGFEKEIRAINANISSWSDNNSLKKYDIVLCDPPFDLLKPDLIVRLTKHVERGGTFVLAWPSGIELPNFGEEAVQLVKEKDYGDAVLVFFKKIG